MKKRASVFLLLVLFGTQLSIAAPKIKRGKKIILIKKIKVNA